jgi:hypothetical protein
MTSSLKSAELLNINHVNDKFSLEYQDWRLKTENICENSFGSYRIYQFQENSFQD